MNIKRDARVRYTVQFNINLERRTLIEQRTRIVRRIQIKIEHVCLHNTILRFKTIDVIERALHLESTSASSDTSVDEQLSSENYST